MLIKQLNRHAEATGAVIAEYTAGPVFMNTFNPKDHMNGSLNLKQNLQILKNSLTFSTTH